MVLQEGKRSDYSVLLDGAGMKLTHIASGVTDLLVDVVQVRFETGPILILAHGVAELTLAFLFQQRMGRELAQSEDASTIHVHARREAAFEGDAGENTITATLGLAWPGPSMAARASIPLSSRPPWRKCISEPAPTASPMQRMTDGAMLELVNVERVTLSDTQLALDLDGHAGEAAKLIGAARGPALRDNKPLVGLVIHALDAGVSAQSLAQLGLQLLGAITPGQVLQLLWTNVVGSAPTPAQLQPLIDIMAQGLTGGEVAVLDSNLALKAMRIDLIGLTHMGIEFA